MLAKHNPKESEQVEPAATSHALKSGEKGLNAGEAMQRLQWNKQENCTP